MRRSPARHVLPQYPIAYPPPYPPYYAPPPQRPAIDRALNMVLWLIVFGLAGITGYLLITPQIPTRPMSITPTAGALSDTGARHGLSDNATAAAVDQAVVDAQPAQAPAQPLAQPIVAQPGALPTAVILIPTAIPVEQVSVVPLAVPLVTAPGSDMRPTPVTVMAYPTALPAAIADDFQLSPDGTCITAPRGGKHYQVCQGWKYQPQEIATVADLIRGGTLPGVEVSQ